jgi:alpha-galactosidase
MKNKIALFLIFFLPTHLVFSHNNKVCSIHTDNTSLIFTVSESGRLVFRYYGKKLSDESVFGSVKSYGKADTDRDLSYEAYPTNGLGYTNEPALSLIHSDGSLITEMTYSEKKTVDKDENVSYTIISLKDKVYDLTVNLHFESYQKEDVITQWVEVKNNESGRIVLKNIYSSFLNLRANSYYLTHFNGAWAGEMNRMEEKLDYGIKSIESRKGVRTTQTENPSFILSFDHPIEENSGICYGGALAWSGNYKLLFEMDELDHLNILCGINPYLSDYVLDRGEFFVTPKMVYTFSGEGQGLISRNFHNWSRRYALNNGYRERPVVLNSWEGAYFNFTEETILKMIDDAASMGVELFVLDDGWFGNKYPRNSDNVGLGDWKVNKQKLPNGLQYLIKHAEKKGVQFGIWIEPEMVNPKSELAEEHPNWIVQSRGRDKITLRNQLLLDLTNPEVQNFIWNMVDNLLSENKGISYIKWDANRHVEQVGSTYLDADKQTHFWVEYTKGLYNIYEKIRTKYPELIFQVCASGGGRIDYGSLPYHNEFWTSDNTDPLKRLYIQHSTNLIYPPVATAAHVSASPNHQTGRITSLKFRFDVAMTGRLGLELQPKDIVGDDWGFARQAISDYKTYVRPLITKGNLYRLISPYDQSNNYASQMYVNNDQQQAVLFVFCTEVNNRGVIPFIHLKGLSPNKSYRIKEINNTGKSSFWGNGEIFKGEFLMNVGIALNISTQFDSAVFILDEVR